MRGMTVAKLRFVFAALLMLTVGAVGGVYYIVNRVGAAIAPAALDSILPANTDVYVAFNHSSDEQAALTKLWNTYNRHVGTAAAVARLQSAYGQEPGVNKSCVDAQRKATSLLNSVGDGIGMALWLPPDGSKAQPQVALLAQLKIVNLLSNGGADQLRDIGSTRTDATYRETQIYKVSARGACGSGAGGGYAALVSNDLVFAQTKAPIERIVDASQPQAATLAGDKDYGATLAALPSARLLTVYVAKRVAALAQKSIDEGMNGLVSRGSSSSLTTQQQRQLRDLLPNVVRPYGMDIAVGADSVSLDTSALPIATAGNAAQHSTPNGGATVVGGNAILYASQMDLAAALKPYLSLLPPGQLQQMEQQTGIDVQRDLLDWMNGEYIVDVNDSVSPAATNRDFVSGLIGSGTGYASTGAPTAPLPGAVEMAWHVDNPAGVQRSLDRILAAANRQASSSSSAVRLTTTTLPDGTVLHTSPSVPGVGYALRGHWLIFSSNLAADAAPRTATLAGDVDYKDVMGRVPGSTAFGGVEYLNVTRLLSLVDRWIAYTNSVRPGTVPAADWTRVEPVVAPLHSVLAYSQLAGKRDAAFHVTVTVK